MIDKDTGGPAFPRPYSHSGFDDADRAQIGMTLRDYFAAKAMQALIVGPCMRDDHFDDEVNDYVAERAYSIADAMLAARASE